MAQGGSKKTLANSFKMGRSTVIAIINEVCDALWEELRINYLSPPDASKWKCIAKEFNNKWNLPNCVGAVEGKHIRITRPPYREKCDVILLASCDANYTFTAVDIGTNCSHSDGGLLLWNSGFGQKLLSGNVDLPEDDYLPGTSTKLPYFMVGDASFPLKDNIMRPYPGSCNYYNVF